MNQTMLFGTRIRLIGFCAIFAMLSMMLFGQAANAWQIPDDALDALRQLQQRQGQRPTRQSSPLDQARERRQLKKSDLFGRDDEEFPPPEEKEPEPSPLEKDYTNRLQAGAKSEQAGAKSEQDKAETEQDEADTLHQFGYDIFRELPEPADIRTGRVPKGYLLGSGDELIFTFHGSKTGTIYTEVDREGRVVIPDFRPIQAAGRTFGDFQQEVKARTSSALLGTEVFVSLASVRMMSVLITGEVAKPGLHRMTSLASVLEGLEMAGGVEKTGSLRNIRVIRDGQSHSIDLYDYLLGGTGGDVALQDGDRIFVPIIAGTVAVAGSVRRPGIYELFPGTDRIDAKKALQLAGGPLRPRGNFYTRISFGADGKQMISDLANGQGNIIDGDVIEVTFSQDIQVGSVTLDGHVRVAGKRALARAKTVHGLIRDIFTLKGDPYLPFAVLKTTDTKTRARVFRAFDLQAILANTRDIALRDQDEVVVFGADDIKYLSSDFVREAILNFAASEEACRAIKELTRVISRDQSDRFAVALRSVLVKEQTEKKQKQRENVQKKKLLDDSGVITDEDRKDSQEDKDMPPKDNNCIPIFDSYDGLLPFVLEHVVTLSGAVVKPGIYPTTGGTRLSSLIAVAGGLANSADRTRVEVLEYATNQDKGTSRIDRHVINLASIDPGDIVISPGSGVKFQALISQQETRPVLLQGEFIRPGAYVIRKGETLSEVIDRAGGLTRSAYPYGAVFTRLSVQQAQKEGFLRTAREINAGLASAALQPAINGQALQVALQISQSLNEIPAVGRVVVEADPAVLKVRPDLDSTLEPGDRIFMPKRPNFVSIVGDVRNPSAVQFVPGKSVDGYLQTAGGLLQSGKRKRAFVVLPNGEAQPARSGSWIFSRGGMPIPPGATIVVPKDTRPINGLLLTQSLVQIVSQLAVAAASITVIGRR